MAEVLGIVASTVTVGSLAAGIAKSAVRLRSYWDQIQDAPNDILDSIEQLEDLSHILADIEDEQRQHSVSSLIFDPTSTSRCLQRCKEGADRLKELTDAVSVDLESSRKMKRKWGSAKVVLKTSQLERYMSRLERAITTLTLALMISNGLYTRYVMS